MADQIGSEENRAFFMESAKLKSANHRQISLYWGKINSIMSKLLIVLAFLTMVLTVIPNVPKILTVVISGLATLLSAVKGFLQPDKRRHPQVRVFIYEF